MCHMADNTLTCLPALRTKRGCAARLSGTLPVPPPLKAAKCMPIHHETGGSPSRRPRARVAANKPHWWWFKARNGRATAVRQVQEAGGRPQQSSSCMAWVVILCVRERLGPHSLESSVACGGRIRSLSLSGEVDPASDLLPRAAAQQWMRAGQKRRVAAFACLAASLASRSAAHGPKPLGCCVCVCVFKSMAGRGGGRGCKAAGGGCRRRQQVAGLARGERRTAYARRRRRRRRAQAACGGHTGGGMTETARASADV